jgi:hypothetical protein
MMVIMISNAVQAISVSDHGAIIRLSGSSVHTENIIVVQNKTDQLVSIHPFSDVILNATKGTGLIQQGRIVYIRQDIEEDNIAEKNVSWTYKQESRDAPYLSSTQRAFLIGCIMLLLGMLCLLVGILTANYKKG